MSTVQLLLLLWSVAGTGPKPDAEPGWLAGCWMGTHEGREYSEMWMKPSGGSMFGLSRTVADGQTVAYEYMQIQRREDGLFFIAMPSRQQEAEFKAVKRGKTEVVFENADHDFPQRIIYRLTEEGALAASIEGVSSGQWKKIDFPMRRVSCVE